MEKSQKKEHLMLYKLIYTVGILVAFLVGKSLPLHGVDMSVYAEQELNAELLLRQTISGDVYRCTLFALGISPYMTSSILVQILSAFRGSEAKARISPKKTSRQIIMLTFIFSAIMAFSRAQELTFIEEGLPLAAMRAIATVEMVAGAMMILWLTVRNKKYGIGGQTALIFLNIVDGMVSTAKGHSVEELAIPLLLSFMAVTVMLIMENTEKRIPVQRISIHNIYADKNYLAIKMNPIGVMPAMFSMAFFMLPQLAVSMLLMLAPTQAELLWLKENMVVTKPLGIVVYVVILYLLTVGFSCVFINPKEMTDQFLKSGDSIQNVHAGKDTKRYLTRTVTGMAWLSATMMSICLGFPLLLKMMGNIDESLAALPTSVMILTGICCNLGREVMAVRHLEAYKPFI